MLSARQPETGGCVRPVAEKHGLSECLSEVLRWGYQVRRSEFHTRIVTKAVPERQRDVLPAKAGATHVRSTPVLMIEPMPSVIHNHRRKG